MLGTGTMGAPIVRNLLHSGMEVRAWNRTPAKAAALAADGALVASSPAAAAAGVTVLITMLTDGAAVEDVMTGPDGALSALGPDAVWTQMSTVGVEWSDRLTTLAARHRVTFVDAPVSGSFHTCSSRPSPTAPPTPRTVKSWSFHSPIPS